ncbi:MAG: hypothetical protein ACRC8S_12985 [Fimbriiglobus sp.]
MFRCQKPPRKEALNIEALELLASGEVLARCFELSSQDRLETPPCLSVWDEIYTSVQQAWRFRGSDPEVFLLIRLAVAGVREIEVHTKLDVIYRELHLENRPGAEGHCGVLNLDLGSKVQRQEVRHRLARLASGNVRMLTDQEMQ